MNAAPRIGSFCSGYGGLDMAVMDVLGGSMAWHCQHEPPDRHGRPDRHQYAARILTHHWPEVPNHGDVTTADWTGVEPVDVVTAGFPCTDISYAGLGAGIKEGTRSGLWFTIARAVGALRPRLVVLENVRAIIGRRPGLDVVLADLARLGFDARWTCVRASDVGAPHQRDRWFLLAWPADAARAGLEGPRLRGRTSGGGGAASDADDKRGHGCWSRGAGRHEPETHRVTAAVAQGDGRDARRPEPTGQLGGSDVALGCPAVPAHTDRDAVRQQPVPEPRRGGTAVAGLPDVEWGAYGPAIARWEHIIGRPPPRPADDQGRLAPVFVEWMMGLPAGHVTSVPAPADMTDSGLRNAQLKALGNGVVPQQAAHALRALAFRLQAGGESL